MYWIAVWRPSNQLMEVFFTESEIAPWLKQYNNADRASIWIKKVTRSSQVSG